MIERSETCRALVKDGYQPLRVQSEDVLLNYNEAGQCYFFKESLCSLHRHEGLSHKPVICRLYPYNLVKTPDGIFVSLLYSCPSVVRAEGSPIEQARDALREMLAQEKVPTLGPVRGHILVTQQSTVTWAEYLKLEKGLLQHLNSDDPVSYLLNAAIQLATPRPARAKFKHFSGQLKAVRQGPFQEFVSSVYAWLTGQDEEALVPIRKPTSSEMKETVERFLRNQIEGKLLIVGPSLVARLILVACALSVLFLLKGSREERFAFIEEKLVSQSNALEPVLLEFEEFLLEG